MAQTNLNKRRWLILAVCCLINLCLGSVYSWSVFASPMAVYLSGVTGKALTSADLAVAYTIANSISPIPMVIGGWFNDRFGPRKVVFAGGFLYSIGIILSGFATSLELLMLTYGICFGFGLGITYGCTINTCVKFFPDKRGLIGGMTTGAYGISSVLLPPVVTTLVEHTGVVRTFQIVGSVFLVVICACSLLLAPCPAGFAPEHGTPPAAQARSAAADHNWKGMLRSPVFYIMLCTLACGAFSGMMIISQASAVATEMIGFSTGAAGIAVSVLALFNTAGRLVAGSLSDRIGRINTLTLACLLSALGAAALFFCGKGTAVLFYIGISVTGLCFGAFMGVFPGFTADQFGAKNNSVNYAIMFVGFALAGYFGPTIMKLFYYADGSYGRAFLAAAVLSVAGALFCFLYRPAVRGKNR